MAPPATEPTIKHTFSNNAMPPNIEPVEQKKNMLKFQRIHSYCYLKFNDDSAEESYIWTAIT